MLPDNQPNYQTVVDVVVQSAQITEKIPQPDGTFKNETTTNQEMLWWKTHDINSNQFGRLAFELKEWERMAKEVFQHMTYNRAKILAEQIMDIAMSYRRSIDAKSSESIRDAHNAKSTMIDKLSRNKTEKIFTTRGEAKRSMFDAFIGKKKQDEYEDD